MGGRSTLASRMLGALFLAGALCGCASVSPLTLMGGEDLAADEKRLWNRSIEEAKRLDESGQLYRDDGLHRYVNQVADTILPDEIRQRKDLQIKLRVIKNPLLNAFALSHGAIYLHTGILAKMDNEAQLATLIAHELTHVTHRHPLQHSRTVQNISTGLAMLQVAALPAGIYGPLVGLLGALGATASVSGYSRSMESEADTVGLRLTMRAGYDPRESPKLFEYLQKDLLERKIDEPFFFGSHPKLEDRKQNYDALIAAEFAKKTGKTGKDDFEKIIAGLLLDNAEMDLGMGRWAFAESAIRRFMALRDGDPRGHYQLGELFRRRAETDDFARAESSYGAAIARDVDYAPPYRGLGMIFQKVGKTGAAKDAFENYLRLAPQADDRSYIQQYIAQIK